MRTVLVAAIALLGACKGKDEARADCQVINDVWGPMASDRDAVRRIHDVCTARGFPKSFEGCLRGAKDVTAGMDCFHKLPDGTRAALAQAHASAPPVDAVLAAGTWTPQKLEPIGSVRAVAFGKGDEIWVAGTDKIAHFSNNF